MIGELQADIAKLQSQRENLRAELEDQILFMKVRQISIQKVLDEN
jgi:hypothetical protein